MFSFFSETQLLNASLAMLATGNEHLVTAPTRINDVRFCLTLNFNFPYCLKILGMIKKLYSVNT